MEAVRPALAVSAAQYLPVAQEVLHLAETLALQGVQLAFGGAAFNWLPALRARIPGHFLAERLEDAVVQMETLLQTALPVPKPSPPPPGFDAALEALRRREVILMGQVYQTLEKEGIAASRLLLFGGEFDLHLRAALALGEMGIVDAFLDWTRGCRQMAWLSEELLRRYLLRYAEALREGLGDVGGPIAERLAAIALEGGEVDKCITGAPGLFGYAPSVAAVWMWTTLGFFSPSPPLLELAWPARRRRGYPDRRGWESGSGRHLADRWVEGRGPGGSGRRWRRVGGLVAGVGGTGSGGGLCLFTVPLLSR
ncbi:MAG: hypothetical protein ACP5SI_03015 [Chloroflexia bacterium]